MGTIDNATWQALGLTLSVLGLAVSAHLTREAIADEGVCTLGMYSDNAVARRVYHGLGYTGDHLWSSRRILT